MTQKKKNIIKFKFFNNMSVRDKAYKYSNSVIFLKQETADKINTFLKQKNEMVQLMPSDCFAKNPYSFPKIKHHSFSNLYSTYVKIQRGFNKIMTSPLAVNFVLNEKFPDYPNLTNIDKKIKNNKYTSIYQFGNDLRNCWDFYFHLYSDSPDDFIKTYYICEFCEDTLKEMEAMTKIKQEQTLGVKEKAKLAEDITKLNPDNIRKMLNMLKEYINESNKENEEKTYEFDIEKLSNDKLIKLKKLVDKCIEIQESDEMKNHRKIGLTKEQEQDNIRQLKVNTLFFNNIFIERSRIQLILFLIRLF